MVEQPDLTVEAKPDRLTTAIGWLAVAAAALHATQASFDALAGTTETRLNLCAVDLVLAAAFGLWVLRRLLRRDFSWPPVRWSALVAVAWLGLSLSPRLKGGQAGDIQVSIRQGAVEIVQFFEYFVAGYIVFVGVLKDERWRRRVLIALALVTVLAVACAGVQYLRAATPVTRIRGTWFENRNSFGAFLALVLPLLFGVSVLGRSWLRRTGLAVLVVAALLVCMAGGPFLALCVGLLVVAALKGPAKFSVTAVILVLVSVSVLPHLSRRNSAVLVDSVALYKTSDPYDVFPAEKISKAQQSLSDKQARVFKKTQSGEAVLYGELPIEEDFSWKWQQCLKEWHAALNMMSRSPLFGVGAGAYKNNVNRFYHSMPKYPADLLEPDTLSGYMVWGASAGVPFLLILFGLFLRCGTSAARAFWQKRERGLAAGILGSLAALAVLGVFTDPIVRGVGVTLVLVLALGEALAAGEGGESSESDSGG